MSAGSERRAAAAPRAVPAPRASRVELRLSCRHLLDRDPLTKSDPSVLLLLRSQNQWVQVGAPAGPSPAATGGLELRTRRQEAVGRGPGLERGCPALGGRWTGGD